MVMHIPRMPHMTIVVYNRTAKAKSIAQKIRDVGGQAIAVSGDITQQNTVDNLIKEAASFGNGKIHIIVNNAGFTWDAVIHKTTQKQWDTMLAIHCTAPFNIIKAAAPFFRVTDGEPRAIVNISSQSGIHGNAYVFDSTFLQTRLMR